MANTATRRKQHEFVDRLTFSIVPVAPFRLDLTAWALRRRRQNIIDRWDGSTYRRILPFGNVPIRPWLSDRPVLSVSDRTSRITSVSPISLET
jgi:hypothetical protein